MKEFLQNNRFTLVGLTLGVVVGVFIFVNSNHTNVYRAVYEYETAFKNSLPEKFKVDTFFICENTSVRNYFKSSGDTVNDFKRSEFILYSKSKLSKEKIKNEVFNRLAKKNINLIYFKKVKVKKKSRVLLVIPLIGLILGYLINLLAPKLTPTNKDNTTAI